MINFNHNNLYIENIKCNGCEQEFCVTLRSDPDDENTKYCGSCYGHVVGLKEFQEVIDQMDIETQVLWQTPTNKVPKSVLVKVNFVDKSRNSKNESSD